MEFVTFGTTVTERSRSEGRLPVPFKQSAFVAAPELVRALARHATPVPCPADRVLFHQGDAPNALYILEEGIVALEMSTPDGRQIHFMETTAGSLLGLPGLIGEEPYTLTATARAGAQVSQIASEAFKGLMQADPLLAMKVLQVLAAEVRSARERYLSGWSLDPKGNASDSTAG